MRRFILFSILLFAGYFSFAQVHTAKIVGTVADEKGGALTYASIAISMTGQERKENRN